MYPAVYAAWGAAAAYYGFPPLPGIFPRLTPAYVFFFTILVVPAALCRVLASLSPAGGEAGRRFLRWGRAVTALGAGLCLGLGAAPARSLRLGLLPPAITGLSGILEEDPRAFPDGRGMGTLALASVWGTGGLRASARGTLPVFFPAEAIPRIRDFGRGAELYLEGSLFAGVRGPLFRARAVHVVRSAPARERFRTDLRQKILEHLPREGESTGGGGAPSWGPLGAALLLGVRDNLDSGLARAFQDAGCSHVLALSGMHLAIISAAIAFFLRKPLGLRAASLLGGGLVSAYVYLAGGQPSLVRAAIMYLLGVLALWGNLKARPLVLLALAFLIQFLLQPRSPASLSFILSYLALGGILLAGDWIHEILRGRLPPVLAQGLSASAGAFLATAAVMAHAFGILRPVGILAGLLLMPLAAVFMLGALGTLALSFAVPQWAGPPGQVLSVLADLQSGLVGIAARFPGLSLGQPLPALALSFLAALLAWYGAKRRRTLRNSLVPFD